MHRLVWIILLLQGVTIPVLANAQTFGSWTADVGQSGDFYYASTINDSGALLGEYCYTSSNTCIWMLGMSTACKKGAQYFVLANSDAGAIQLDLLCTGQLSISVYRYAFTNFNAIDNLVRKGRRVGFAFPLEVDQFIVLHFDLSRSNTAISAMKNAFERARKSPTSPPSNTKDEIM